MRKILFIIFGIIIFLPNISNAFVASDFIINRQSTYAIPYNTPNVLVLDLILPAPDEGKTLQLKSIKIHNAGTADHTNISKLMIWEDGSSGGWNNDERAVVTISSAPFFDTEIFGNFRAYSKGDARQRIFVTIDTSETGTIERNIQLQVLANSVIFTASSAAGPTDAPLTGFERKILTGSSTPSVPVTPLAGTPEVLSSFAIRWHFIDLSNNEFGFRLVDGSFREITRQEDSNISYLDETGLLPDTDYSGRRIIAFNDRGESGSASFSLFPTVRTLAQPEVKIMEEKTAEIKPAENQNIQANKEPTLAENIQTKIADIQRQINEFIIQLNALIRQSGATIFGALQGFLRSFFGK